VFPLIGNAFIVFFVYISDATSESKNPVGRGSEGKVEALIKSGTEKKEIVITH